MNAASPRTHPDPAQCLPPLAPVRRGRVRLPEGACDTHAHVFGPVSAYPLDPARGYTPSIVTWDDYRAVMSAFGIDRAVLVQPSVYGFDNRVLLDALAAMPERLRGVAVIAPDAPDATYKAAHRQGVRGVRVNTRNPAGLGMGDIHTVAARIVELGWHIQLQTQIESLAAIAQSLSSDLPMVIDHFGYPDLARGPDAPAFRQLVDLAAAGRCFVKLSASYRIAGDAKSHGLLTPFVKRLVREAPHALLWALDWPHTECFDSVPDDNDILDLMEVWFPDEALRRTVLCDNPQRLYWAAAARGARGEQT